MENQICARHTVQNKYCFCLNVHVFQIKITTNRTPPFNCHTTEVITPNQPINEILEDLIRDKLQSQNILQHADKILHFVRMSKCCHKLALNTASLIFTEEEQVQACYQTNSFLTLNQSKIDRSNFRYCIQNISHKAKREQDNRDKSNYR